MTELSWAERQRVDRQSRLPFYVQLADLLRERIEEGSWGPGERLPSEAELCQWFGVSRTVVRQSLSELVHEGLILREQGRGSFVAQPKISEALVQRLTGFHQDMAERGLQPVNQVLRQVSLPASTALARHLRVKRGTPLITIDRLRFIRDEPIVLVSTCIPLHFCPRLLEVDLTHRSLYEVLEQEAGLVISRGRRWIEAVAASARQAALLRVEKGAPLIRLESVSFLADGTPVEFYDAIHRSDRARFEVDLVRFDGGRDSGKDGEPGSRGTWSPGVPEGAPSRRAGRSPARVG